MDPNKRLSADEILNFDYFNLVKEVQKEPSPRPVMEKRVHSSTYRTGKYMLVEGDEDIDSYTKRNPSHSNERTSQMRSTGIFGTLDLRSTSGGTFGINNHNFASTPQGGLELNNNSALSSNQNHGGEIMIGNLLGDKKKSFSINKGTFSYGQTKEPVGTRKDSAAYRRAGATEEHRENSRQESPERPSLSSITQALQQPIAGGALKRKGPDPKKSTSNFRMFRISIRSHNLEEEIEYDTARGNPKGRNKSRKKEDMEQLGITATGFLPTIAQASNIMPLASKRGNDYQQSIYGSFSKPVTHKFDLKSTKAGGGTTFFLMGK